MVKLQGFSFSQLSTLQVQGAIDRSNRQIEHSQVASRLQNVDSQWRASMEGKEMDEQLDEHFTEAILAEFHDRELSPYMIQRLVKIGRMEFAAGKSERGLVRLHDDYRESFNWMYEQMERIEQERSKEVMDLQRQIDTTKLELEALRLKRTEDFIRLEAGKKELLLRRKGQLLDGLERDECKKSRHENHQVTRTPEATDSSDLFSAKSDLLHIEENYFPHSSAGGSEWVLCS